MDIIVTVPTEILIELDEAEEKAWNALAYYKFWMFGYWSSIWIHLNRISGAKRPNPWHELVMEARERVKTRTGQGVA